MCEEEVKPCPWCKQIPEISVVRICDHSEWSIHCVGTTTKNWCHVRPRLNSIGDKAVAIKLWNNY